MKRQPPSHCYFDNPVTCHTIFCAQQHGPPGPLTPQSTLKHDFGTGANAFSKQDHLNKTVYLTSIFAVSSWPAGSQRRPGIREILSAHSSFSLSHPPVDAGHLLRCSCCSRQPLTLHVTGAAVVSITGLEAPLPPLHRAGRCARARVSRRCYCCAGPHPK